MIARFTIDQGTVTIGDLTLQLAQECPGDAWRTKDRPGLLLHKGPYQLATLDQFFTANSFEPKFIFELGIWDGGSTAFWFEYFQPDKLVAVDHLDREDDPEFRAYAEQKRLSARIKTYWRTDQSDRERLQRIVAEEFDSPLDLVIDDASHELHATRASFETLFPLLRRGHGIYLIEDWSWETNPRCRAPDPPLAKQEGLVGFVKELVDGIPAGAVRQLLVWRGFAAVWRGVTAEERAGRRVTSSRSIETPRTPPGVAAGSRP